MRHSQNTFIYMVSINAKINTSFCNMKNKSQRNILRNTMLSVLYTLNEKILLRLLCRTTGLMQHDEAR